MNIMEYYVKKEFKLREFPATDASAETLMLVEDMGIINEAEEYIVDNLKGREKVTNDDINDFIFYELDSFIDDIKQKRDDELLEHFKITGITQGELYAVEHEETLELVTETYSGETCVIYYNNLTKHDIWTVREDNTIHVLNKYINNVGVYEVDGSYLVLTRTYQL